MSTLAAADLSSDDENDQDFKPAEAKPKSDRTKKRRRSRSASGSSSSDSDDQDVTVESEEAAALRIEAEMAEAEERKKRAQAAFETMKAGGTSSASSSAKIQVPMVTVQRARRFAGETLYETVQVPADNPEAIAYLKQGVSNPPAGSTEPPNDQSLSCSEYATPATEAPAGSSKPKAKPPPRRKPRQSLEAMSAALDKGKKMTTLEKSQLDWKNHTSKDQSINDELEANRKAGGYLQKKDFLERVGERRMDTFESRQARQR